MGASIMAAECLTAVIKILFKNLDRTGRELSCVCQIRIELCRTQIRITNGSSDSTVSLSHDLLCGISRGASRGVANGLEAITADDRISED